AFLFLLVGMSVPVYQRVFLSNPTLRRFREARKAAAGRISEAETALARSDVGRAGGTLGRALQSYLAAKLNLEEGAISLRTASDMLQDRKVPTATIDHMKHLWNILDLYQFAPAQSQPEEIRQSLTEFKGLVANLEKEILWRV